MLVGLSPVIQDLRQRIARVAATTFTVLIEGESGVGKELVAREIHASSRRCRGPFVAVNCAAIVETLLEAELFGIEERTATGVKGRKGKFEMADSGTLFLDEVSDLSPLAQAKLLRVLQDMAVERVGGAGAVRVDTRIVVATNRSLRTLVDAGKFRADLYYRLAGIEIAVPPLRSRRDDIRMLAEHFLDGANDSRGLTIANSAIEAMVIYDWPGNVRQLLRVVERAVALAPGPAISSSDLPTEIGRGPQELLDLSPGTDASLRAWSSRYARLVLERCLGNKRRACEVLDISYHTLQALLEYRSLAPDRPNRQAAGSSSELCEAS
jgi:DNA-binding NtrC family response regulator